MTAKSILFDSFSWIYNKFILIKSLFSKPLNSDNHQLYLKELILSGQVDLARKHYVGLKPSSLSDGFQFTFCRYLDRKNLLVDASQAIHHTRALLEVEFRRNNPSPYLLKLASFKNIVVVSNSSLLKFTESDLYKLKSLENPLFVYLNISNTSICDLRKYFYGPSAKEVLIGGHHHVVDSNHKLFFRPFSLNSFLGCIVRVNSRFQKLWFDELRLKTLAANPSINFYQFEEALLIESAYPLTVYRDTGNKLRKRIPTVGWLALSLLDAIGSMPSSNSPDIWLAGFSMSPSYIFSACENCNHHDFCLEKEALDYRFRTKLCKSIGFEIATRQDTSTGQKLSSIYPGRIQLSKYLRKQNRI